MADSDDDAIIPVTDDRDWYAAGHGVEGKDEARQE